MSDKCLTIRKKCSSISERLLAEVCAHVYVRMMGTAAELKTALGPATGMHSASLDRYLQTLADARIIRRSRSGGGKANYHLNSWELASICLSLASFTPGGAAAAAQALGRLSPEKPQAGDATLLTSLAGTIESYGRDIQRGVKAHGGDDDWQLTLSLEPLFAMSAWPTRGPQAIRRWLYYSTSAGEPELETNEPPALRRQTILTKPLLIIIADNYARTPDEGRHPARGGVSTP
jgi:hypothetical protein